MLATLMVIAAVEAPPTLPLGAADAGVPSGAPAESVPLYQVAGYVYAAGRTAVGLVPIVSPQLFATVLGIAPADDTRTLQLVSRLFGVRELMLGVALALVAHDRVWLHRSAWLNLAVDALDAVLIGAISLGGRQGIDRTALIASGFALGASLTWLLLAWLTREI